LAHRFPPASPDQKRDGGSGLPRVAVGSRVDAHDREGTTYESGLFLEFADDRLFNRFPEFDEPSWESPFSPERRPPSPDQEYRARSDPHGIDR